VRLGGARKNGSYLQAQFHRLRARRGAKKAIGALAASILLKRSSHGGAGHHNRTAQRRRRKDNLATQLAVA
jgi:hypothetical protein